MESVNSTLEADNGNSSTMDDSLPSTASVLDKSKSLFGNSSAAVALPQREPTPETSVAMEAVEEQPADQEDGDNAEEDGAVTREEPEIVQKEEEEEVFEKKLVSMDTSGAEEPQDANEEEEEGEEQEKEEEQAENLEEIGENTEEIEETEEKEPELVENDGENPEEDEDEQEEEEEEGHEEEIPKKKSKRVASPSKDDEASEHTPDQQEDAAEAPESPEAPEVAEELDEPETAAKIEPEAEENGEEVEEEAAAPTPKTPQSGRGSRARKTPSSSAATPKRATRQSRGAKEPEPEEPEQEEPEEVEEVPKRGRARRSAPKQKEEPEKEQEEVKEEEEEAVEEEQEETPKRAGRGRRSVPSAAPTPRSARGRARKSDVQEPEEKPEEPEPEEQKRTPRARKSTANTEEEAEAPSSSRRSTRAKAAPKPATPAVKRTPRSGQRKKQTSLTEETIEEADETVESPSPSKKTKSTPSKKKDAYDPYDLDTEMEHHPEPLKNIQMEVQNFGGVKYAKAGNSESKYSMTERAAESRIGDLTASSSVKNRRSLADMTPGKEKSKPRSSIGTGRRSKGVVKKEEDAHENDVTMEEPTSSSTPSNRGKKRKSEATLTTPPSKKQPAIAPKELSDEEQLKADHPDNDMEPHAPGARVYAIFQKMFYPALILTERDGLGRYKVLFTLDNVVKDVPNSGIIPIRALIPGKKAIFEEEEVRLDEGPDDISAAEWHKGKVTITMLDENEEPTEESRIVNWTDISFDQSEWRDYVKSKDQNATAIVTSNITTMSEATRARKVAQQPVAHKSQKRSKRKEDGMVSSRAGSGSPDDDDDRILPMKEEAVGKNIFAGKVFLLTSANRATTANISAMFRKKNLMTFITDNGGIVTEHLNELQERYSSQEPILISDTYYRTHKFLAALARGIPCVKNVWLQECGEKGECVDYENFLLSAGASIFTDEDMPAPKNPSELLKGRRIYVHSTHAAREITQIGPGGTFTDIWKPILELLGATAVEAEWTTLSETNPQFDVLLVDGTYQEEVMEYATSIGAAKVTSEWVIQTIILGEAPEPDAHPKFDPTRLHQRL